MSCGIEIVRIPSLLMYSRIEESLVLRTLSHSPPNVSSELNLIITIFLPFSASFVDSNK